ncbi:MAG: response regulator [Pseudomonadota bacterium]|nr:MAG: two-component system response regulator [Pseudomonadota bacterium]
MSEVDVLLVEDNPDDAELTLRALRKSNVAERLLHVDDGAKAIEFLFGGAKPPRFILLDLKLPKIDGLEVLRRVKADARTRTIPVVVLTSSKEERDVMASYDLGVNSYIVKPVGFEQYMRTISEVGRYWNDLNQLPQTAL